MPLAQTQGLELYTVRIKSVQSTDPAANTELSYTIPSGQLFELYAVNFNLVTDATVATRRVTLVVDDGTNIFAKSASLVTQAASLTYNYTFGVGAADRSAVAGTDVLQDIPGPLFLAGGYKIRTVTTAIQATDNYGIMTIQGIRYAK